MPPSLLIAAREPGAWHEHDLVVGEHLRAFGYQCRDHRPPVAGTPQIKCLFPALKDPRNRHKAVGFTHDEFHYAFTNTLGEEDSQKIYDRYHVPAPGNWVWAYGVIANIKPGHQETWVNYRNPNRAPLLFIGGSEDHIMPPSVNRSNAMHYKGEGTITDYVEFAGRDHWTCGGHGWEQVADFALEWAVARATGAEAPSAPTIPAAV